MFAELRWSSGLTRCEMGGNWCSSWVRDCPDRQRMAVGFPGEGFIPSEPGQLLQRKTLIIKGTDIQQCQILIHVSGGAGWRNTHLWSSFSTSLGKKKKDAIQGLWYPKQYFKKLASLCQRVQRFSSQYATNENVIYGKNRRDN